MTGAADVLLGATDPAQGVAGADGLVSAMVVAD
jgi:hypothetical protein